MTPIEAPPLKDKLLKSSMWVIATRWGLRSIGVISTAILARLLQPEDFGLIALSMIAVGFTQSILSFGVDTALIQNQQTTRNHFDTAWTIKIIQSTTVAISLFLAADLIANFFNEERSATIIRILCLGLFLQGFANIGTVNFRKELEFHKEFAFSLTTKLAVFFTTITAAYILKNYWALVIGMLLGQVIGVGISYIAHPFRPKISLKAAGDIWRVSQWMFIINNGYFFITRGDELVVGRSLGTEEMGGYSVASELAELPTTEIIFPISRALMPGYAKLKSNPERLKNAYLNTLSITTILSIPMGFGIFIVSPQIVPLLLGPGWELAIPAMQWLALFAALRTIYGGAGNLLIVVDAFKPLAVITWAQAIFLVYGSYVGATIYNLEGIAIAKLLTGLVFFFVYFGVLKYHTTILWADIFRIIWRPTIAGVAMFFSLYLIDFGSYEYSLITCLTLNIASGIAIYSGLLLLLWQLSKRPNGGESFALEMINSSVNQVWAQLRKLK